MSQPYRPDIDGLRAVAVVVVLAYHFGMPGLSGGFVGVDVFFVISGYLITGIIATDLAAGRFRLADFYERRARRILPAAFVVFAATTVVAVLTLMPGELKRFGDELATASVFASNLLYGTDTGYFDPPARMRILLHTWSLGVEEQFYLLFPLLLIALARLAPCRLGSAIGGLALASLAAAYVIAPLDPERSFFWLHTRFWELALGALLALGTIRSPAHKGAREILAAAGLLAILSAALFYSETLQWPGLATLAPTLGAAALIASGRHGPTVAGRLLSFGPMVAVGRASYSLYLWHWPLIVLPAYLLTRPLDGMERLALAALAVGLGFLSLRFVEQPFRSRRLLPSRPAMLIAAGVGTLLLGLGGAGFILGKGLPGRLPPDVRAIASVSDEQSAFEAHCKVGQPAFTPDNCLLGDTTRPRIDFALIGDSHALALADALDAQAKVLGIKGVVISRRGCMPVAASDGDVASSPKCLKRFREGLAFVAKARIPLAVVVAKWNLYATATGPDAATRAMRRTVADLSGSRVVLVTQAPPLGFDAPSMVARRVLFGLPLPDGPAALPRESTAERLAGENPEIILIRSADRLCGPRTCAYIDDGRLLYRDDDHLSRAGAERLMPLFMPVLAASASASFPVGSPP